MVVQTVPGKIVSGSESSQADFTLKWPLSLEDEQEIRLKILNCNAPERGFVRWSLSFTE